MSEPEIKRGPGRPTLYNEELADKIVAAIRKGNSQKTAAEMYRLDDETIIEWKKKYPEFADRMREARSWREDEVIDKLNQNIEGGTVRKSRIYTKPDGSANIEDIEWTLPDQRAIEYYLSRRNPKDWGQNATLKIRNMTDRELLIALQGEIDAMLIPDGGDDNGDNEGTEPDEEVV